MFTRYLTCNDRFRSDPKSSSLGSYSQTYIRQHPDPYHREYSKILTSRLLAWKMILDSGRSHRRDREQESERHRLARRERRRINYLALLS